MAKCEVGFYLLGLLCSMENCNYSAMGKKFE